MQIFRNKNFFVSEKPKIMIDNNMRFLLLGDRGSAVITFSKGQCWMSIDGDTEPRANEKKVEMRRKMAETIMHMRKFSLSEGTRCRGFESHSRFSHILCRMSYLALLPEYWK